MTDNERQKLSRSRISDTPDTIADRLASILVDVEERLERETAHEIALRQPA